MYITSCRSSVVEEAPVARLLPPARGLLLGRGAGMLKESTLIFEKAHLIDQVLLGITSLKDSLVSVFPIASCLALSRPLSDRSPRTAALHRTHKVRRAVRQNGWVRHPAASLLLITKFCKLYYFGITLAVKFFYYSFGGLMRSAGQPTTFEMWIKLKGRT